MKRVAVLAAVAVAAAALWRVDAVRARFGEPDAPALPTLVVGRETLIESAVALGTIKPQVGAEVRVGSRASGVVAELRVAVGDRVAKGDLLAALESGDRKARVAALRSALDAAAAEAAFAESERARAAELAGLVSKLELDRLRRNVDVRRAETERARAALAEAEVELSYTTIRAPVAGTVASVSTSVGETVAASFAAPTFVTLVDLERLEVQAYVDESDIGRVEVGQPVALRVDAFAGSELPGTVRAIYPKAELVNNVVNYVVIVDLADRQGLLLRPEMTVHVDFLLERREDVIAVPRAALVEDGARRYVVVEEGGLWRERPVTTGLRTPQRIEVVSGLVAGETIVADKQAWQARRERER